MMVIIICILFISYIKMFKTLKIFERAVINININRGRGRF